MRQLVTKVDTPQAPPRRAGAHRNDVCSDADDALPHETRQFRCHQHPATQDVQLLPLLAHDL